MKLSKRLETVASFVKKGSSIADVGTDHGYIPIALMERGWAVKAVAMDVRPGPLKRARCHIRERGLEEKIETRLGDGVKTLARGEADTVIIAGMGGELVIHILEEGRALWDTVDQWILSPQSDLDKVRRYLEQEGFVIAREDMTREDGKYYTVMEAVRPCVREKLVTEELPELREAGYLYGAGLIRGRHPVLLEFLEREERQVREILKSLEAQEGARAAARKEELTRKLSWIEAARNEMKGGMQDEVP